MRPSRAYTLTETVVVLGLVLLALVAVSVGARTWLTSQQTDRATTTLAAMVAAQELHHGRFGQFTADPAQIEQLVTDVTVAGTSNDTDQVVVATGSYTDASAGTLQAVAVAVADGATCRWTRVPTLDVRADRASGQFDGACDTAAVASATGVSP